MATWSASVIIPLRSRRSGQDKNIDLNSPAMRRRSTLRTITLALQSMFVSGAEDLQNCDIGGGGVRYRPESLAQLCQMTKFSKKEIQLLYRGFKQGCPTGVVTVDQFKDIYAQFFPHGSKSNADPGRYALHVFNSFDRDRNGHISFEEFAVGLSILSRGSMEEKLRWVFELYDVDQDGLLTRVDLENVIGSIYDMMGSPTDPPIEDYTVKDHVEYVFHKMDEDNDGSISVEEFLIACQRDDSICQSLGLFDTILSSSSVDYGNQ